MEIAVAAVLLHRLAVVLLHLFVVLLHLFAVLLLPLAAIHVMPAVRLDVDWQVAFSLAEPLVMLAAQHQAAAMQLQVVAAPIKGCCRVFLKRSMAA